MAIQKAYGRPPKVDHKVIIRLMDSIQHNSSISEACRYAGISRDTYYRYLSNEVFAERMATAKDNQNRVVFSFLTVL